MEETKLEINLVERQLIRRARDGDQRAFQQLLEAYAVPVWRTVCVLIANRSVAEDVLQEAWIDVWRGLPSFQEDRAFRPWLLTVVANRCHKNGRRFVLPSQSLETVETDMVVRDDGLFNVVFRKEVHNELRKAIGQLSEEQQRTLELRYFAELELAEIAAVLQISTGTVKSRLHRAINRLKVYLPQNFLLEAV